MQDDYYRSRAEALEKERDFLRREKSFYKVRAEVGHELGKAVATGIVGALILAAGIGLLNSDLSDGVKVSGLALLVPVIGAAVRVRLSWKSPEESFHRQLENEKRDKELREAA